MFEILKKKLLLLSIVFVHSNCPELCDKLNSALIGYLSVSLTVMSLVTAGK
jgi:hypothetical protein